MSSKGDIQMRRSMPFVMQVCMSRVALSGDLSGFVDAYEAELSKLPSCDVPILEVYVLQSPENNNDHGASC